jgi:aminoglycoside phosphotransferase (APT) family kinase protein
MVTAQELPMALRLERFLAAMEPEHSATVRSCQPITGGYSRETAIAEVHWDDGRDERLILRGDPPPDTGVFRSDRDAECDVLRWLSTTDTVSIAPLRHYDATGHFFGTKCLVMGFVNGRPLQAVAAEPGNEDSATQLFVETFARLHSTPLTGCPAGMTVPTDYRSYLDSMADVYLATEQAIGDSDPILRYTAAVMRAHTPPPLPFSLVHGDCQPGNVLVADGRPPVTIDWEFARVGDPREDLGYYGQIPLEPNLYTRAPEDFLARYRALTGYSEEQVNPVVVDYFLLVGMANLLSQMLHAADSIGRGGRGGLGAYLINGICHQHALFMDICKRVERAGWE